MEIPIPTLETEQVQVFYRAGRLVGDAPRYLMERTEDIPCVAGTDTGLPVPGLSSRRIAMKLQENHSGVHKRWRLGWVLAIGTLCERHCPVRVMLGRGSSFPEIESPVMEVYAEALSILSIT